jgi:hypothetical protein
VKSGAAATGARAVRATLSGVIARRGWYVLLTVVVVTVAVVDTWAARNNQESLTSTFRRGVAETAWRWPVLVFIVLLVAHLFMPPGLRKYDPLDRLYYRINPVSAPDDTPGTASEPAPSEPGTGSVGGATTPTGASEASR